MHRVAAAALLACLALGSAACREKAAAEVEVTVRQVSFDPATGSPVVLLEDARRGVALPIWIGPAEAQAIALEMEHVRPPRPLTHDLMRDVLQRAGVEMRRAVIHDLRKGTYYARVRFSTRRGAIEVDSRPSDAIALALRFGSPIFVTARLLTPDNVVDVTGASAPGVMRIGGVLFQDLTPELAELFGVPGTRGVVVADAGSGASGLRRGDVVVSVEGREVRGVAALQRELQGRGKSATLSILREGRSRKVRFDPRGAAGG